MTRILFLFTLLCFPLFSNEPTWKNHMRVKTLKNLDLLLHWGLGKQNTTYPLAHPPEEELLSIPLLELTNFSHDYGYFSLTRPLVGEVSSSKKDLEIALDILHSLYKNQVKGSTLQLATAEILTKIIAYRDLQLGQTLSIPFQTDTQLALETFTVDHIFDIWNGMPAFGLTSPHSSLLLFRGTDFSHLNKRAIASLLSDLDLAGPGLQAFNNARPTLHSWLKQMHSQGKPAQVMGFSLGGALAAYTYIYEHPLLSSSPSISICAPGVGCQGLSTRMTPCSFVPNLARRM